MASSNGHKTVLEVDSLVDSLMARLQDNVRNMLVQAVNDGAKLGGETARRQLVERLEGADIPVGNDAPKRDRSLRGTVTCPVPNCARPGSRQLRCFCRKHYESLPAERREELRSLQIKKKVKAKEEEIEKKLAEKHRAA